MQKTACRGVQIVDVMHYGYWLSVVHSRTQCTSVHRWEPQVYAACKIRLTNMRAEPLQICDMYLCLVNETTFMQASCLKSEPLYVNYGLILAFGNRIVTTCRLESLASEPTPNHIYANDRMHHNFA